jgi:hypothetical protein
MNDGFREEFNLSYTIADLGERIDIVDRQLQLSRFHRAPDVLAGFVKDFADFLDGVGAEGDADVVDAAVGANKCSLVIQLEAD